MDEGEGMRGGVTIRMLGSDDNGKSRHVMRGWTGQGLWFRDTFTTCRGQEEVSLVGGGARNVLSQELFAGV